MKYVIKNDYLTAVISSHGAELIKLEDMDGVNRMHTPSNDTWNRVSPILFPQISRMPNSEYKVMGQTFNMTTHGFIRDNELEVVNYQDSEIIFKFVHNEKTRKMYPYEFIFYVTYKLVLNAIEVTFKIENISDNKMLYMLGGHPGFKIPLYENEKYTDYQILFETTETTKRMCVVDGFLANKYEDYLVDDNTINLNHNLFTDDALVFRGLKSKYVDIVSNNHNKKIRFHFSDFEILAIWSKVNEDINLLCLEPWNGIQKEFVIEHEKMGVLEVMPNSYSVHGYIIEVI